MPFGKHKGKPLAEVPEDYWLWLFDQKVPIHDPVVKKHMEDVVVQRTHRSPNAYKGWRR